jgi:4-hydroxy-tetrahydrodipicolinate synthase
MVQKKLTGTGVAIITPFRKDGSVDFKSLDKLLEHLIKGGVDYIVALGTTGESVTLSKDEKKAVVNSVIESVGGRVPIVVGVGGNNTQEILDSLNYGDFNNIDAILSVSPYYNKPSQQGIYEHFKTIAGISPVPVILYNVPGRTGSNMTGETTVRLAKDFGNIVAIKEASGNMAQIMHILKYKPADFLVISGDDLITLPMMSMGAVGAISVIANAYPAEFSQMVNFARNGNFAKAANLQFKLLDMMIAIFEEGSPSGVKATLEILKVSPNNLRLPLVPVSDAMYKKLERLVKLV